ncbi:oxidoreductase [Diaporthe amygdali]|uniref:oxidoreductase n=1 Tax=Phomopsis amygdali TaxID=1214568 RepID=UPI0022FDBEE8|nr:oxidoreductase [Diaporthe amygdali]KAJ0114207.1 oxidoreductase [Diaporthe amygdali]
MAAKPQDHERPTVLITGCSAGSAGNALALEFAARGFCTFATARSRKALSNLEEKGIETFILDVTKPESITALKDEIVQLTGGTLNILFNNAGTLYEAPAIEADRARVRSLFDTNVFGLFDMVTAFTPLLLAAVPLSKQPPTIVNTASVLARLPSPFSSAYNATKAAVASYSDTLRLEVEPLGLKVVTLYMGEVSTPLMSADNINFGSDSIYADVEHKVKERSLKHEKTTMSPTEFARQVVHALDGSGNSYIWKGTNAFVVWFLNAVGGKKVFDSTMKSAVGFNDATLRRNLHQKGQAKHGQSLK